MSSGVSAPVSPLTRYEARRPVAVPAAYRSVPVESRPNAVGTASVADIEEPARWRQIDLRTGVAYGHACGQRGDRFHRGERAGRAIDAVGRHAAPLLVGEIGEIERGVEAIVPR